MTLTLVGIVDAEITEPEKRRARRDEIRDALWDLVLDEHAYPNFDAALAAYAAGSIDIPRKASR